jgi:CRP/FNR family transcriptional regulator
MIRNNFRNPNRASFGRCTACGLRSLSICGALDDADISELERMARHVHLAPNEALFTAGEVAGSADAVDNVSACRFPVEAFTHFIEERPQLLLRINEFAARELMLAQEQMLLLGRRSSEEKIASFLVGWRNRLAQIGDNRDMIALPMSRQDIADYLGLTIETVSRTLTRFEREKLLIIMRGGVRLLDQNRAAALAAA